MKYQHLRHASALLHYGGLEILIDPIFAPKEVNPPIRNSWNTLRNPRTEFPLPLSSFKCPEYCLVTHLHSDHFDSYAQALLSKNTYLLCQPENVRCFEKMRFVNILPIAEQLSTNTLTIHRVPAQHGTGIIAELMGSSSGYVLEAPYEPTLYITGDTIFYDKVKATLDMYKPDVIIAFGGAAQFVTGAPITLTQEDILKLHEASPQSKIICVHMDAINHCRATRASLKAFLSSKFEDNDVLSHFLIPFDGEIIEL